MYENQYIQIKSFKYLRETKLSKNKKISCFDLILRDRKYFLQVGKIKLQTFSYDFPYIICLIAA